MNSSSNPLIEKNLKLFKERFPSLFQVLIQSNLKIPPALEVEESKGGAFTACDNSTGKKLYLHSKYNPLKEAESLVSSFDPKTKKTAVFMGFGLGYGAVEAARKFPDKEILLFEPDPNYLYAALCFCDWTDLFMHKRLVVAVGATSEQASSFLTGKNPEEIHIFKTPSQTAHAHSYFEEIEKALFQAKQKEEINNNTLEKFARLWQSNSCRNIDQIQKLKGVSKYYGTGLRLPFTIIAAGPSLDRILPHLEEIKKRSVVVCVDTALHAMLRHNVQPDFVILADPQYYASLHLEFLEAPDSVLITEIASYPSVMRFKCREKVLFSSQFPIGEYFERISSSPKGTLAAGGSVTTSAWDFARRCGASSIYIAGMDLGFPGKQTHIRGSQFEEKVHFQSTRTNSSETMNVSSLCSGVPMESEDYNGNKIITDKKMSLFSWWFENECGKTKSIENITTYTLTPESKRIKNIEISSVKEFLSLPDISGQKEKFLSPKDSSQNLTEAEFDAIKKEFVSILEELISTAKKGISLCDSALKFPQKIPETMQKLNSIDSKIMNSNAKDAASLVFPTKRQLEKIASDVKDDNLRYSKLIYAEILRSAQSFLEYF